MTADGCVRTSDTTQLDVVVGKFVLARRDCRQLVAKPAPTLLNSTVALRRSASAVCTGV